MQKAERQGLKGLGITCVLSSRVNVLFSHTWAFWNVLIGGLCFKKMVEQALLQVELD